MSQNLSGRNFGLSFFGIWGTNKNRFKNYFETNLKNNILCFFVIIKKTRSFGPGIEYRKETPNKRHERRYQRLERTLPRELPGGGTE